MDIWFNVALILSKVVAVLLPLSLILLVAGAILDLWKRKFRWVKLALIFFAFTFILIIVEIKFVYWLTATF